MNYVCDFTKNTTLNKISHKNKSFNSFITSTKLYSIFSGLFRARDINLYSLVSSEGSKIIEFEKNEC